MKETTLDPKVFSPEIQSLSDALMHRVIGQERAIKQIIKAYVPMTVNMHRDGRPLGVFLFMGPTGVGKTELARTFAEKLLGSRDSITRIDCVEFDESHLVSRLIGSPPGYIGYNDKPLLSQDKLDQYQTKEKKVNILLFDEIEKAHDRLFDSIMTIMGDGRLTLGNGNPVDFTKTFVFLTSNLGSSSVRAALLGKGIGFDNLVKDSREDTDEYIYRISKEAATKKFRPEFINRLDSLVVFRSLSRDTLRKILKLELGALQWRIWRSVWRDFTFDAGKSIPARMEIVFKLDEGATEFLLDEGTSDIYGARELNRTIDRYVAYPLASLIASGQLKSPSKVLVRKAEGEKNLTFARIEE